MSGYEEATAGKFVPYNYYYLEAKYGARRRWPSELQAKFLRSKKLNCALAP